MKWFISTTEKGRHYVKTAAVIFFPSSSLGYIWQTITTQQYAQIGLPLAPWLRAEHRDEAGAVITGGLRNSNFSFGFLIILPPLGL